MKQIKQDGFPYTFNPDSCLECEGRCCSGKSGYIWVNAKEIENIAGTLGMNQIDFMQHYLNRVGNRWSIKEKYSGSQVYCVFFSVQDKRCTIYQSRPTQCHRFPFWAYYRDHVDELLDECPGVRINN